MWDTKVYYGKSCLGFGILRYQCLVGTNYYEHWVPHRMKSYMRKGVRLVMGFVFYIS